MPKKQRCHLKNIVRICEKLLTLALLLDASMTAESDWQLRRTAGQQIFHLPLRGKPMLDIRLMALFQPDNRARQRRLLRAKRTSPLRARTSEFDPLRTQKPCKMPR
jgi:hypothetical protein